MTLRRPQGPGHSLAMTLRRQQKVKVEVYGCAKGVAAVTASFKKLTIVSQREVSVVLLF